MRVVLCAVVVAVLAAGIALGAGGKTAETPPASTARLGAGSLYDRYCAACHGDKGDGAGAAAPWLWPKPRDFTRGRYKWRSTASGKAPTDDDLKRVIQVGVPGTSMPGFRGILDDAQTAELVGVLKAFAPSKFARAATPVVLPVMAVASDALVARGKTLWEQTGCAACHGAGGRGDGPSAAQLVDDQQRPAPPFDLTTQPLRRGRDLASLYLTLVTGLDGTPMPSFETLPAEDLSALAAFVSAQLTAGGVSAIADPTAVDPRATAGAPAVVVGLRLGLQGEAPAALPPAAASLSAKQCGRCHAKQLREWSTSLHGRAVSPGLRAQFLGAKAKFVDGCLRCHAPLAEQLPYTPDFDEDLYTEGANCAGCHVRGWTRHGPPRRADAALLEIPSYPVVEEAVYERSEFCLPCHQLAPTNAVNGRPLLNTYREWLEGPYMRRGVQCQHCHMPDREHTWKGGHDPATVKQAFKISTLATPRKGGGVDVSVVVKNVGAGHYAPTTPTPAAFLTVTLLDAKGKPLADAGATLTKRIGRHIEYTAGAWKELEDTRIPPGESLYVTPRFAAKVAQGAHAVRVTLTFAPDDYYQGFYERWLARKPKAAQQALFEEALAAAKKSKFVVYDKVLPLR